MPVRPDAPRRRGLRRGAALLLLVLVAGSHRVEARPRPEILDAEERRQEAVAPDGIHVLDGSCVLDHGNLYVNITNHGLIGSQYTQTYPYSAAPSGQWPGGSGDEYLWGAGIWIGGFVNSQLSVTTGQPERELRPEADVRATIYEARENRQVRPIDDPALAGRRPPYFGADDDGDGAADEDMLNGIDDDGDGAVDEDFGQIGDQMFTCTMFDDTALVRELYPDHSPLGLEVVQRAATLAAADADDFIMLEYTITNRSIHTISDIHLGTYVDCDIQRRGAGASDPDDLAGYFNGAVRGSDGSFHRLQIGWMRDADPEHPLPGVFGAMLLGHTTDPLEYWAPHIVGVESFHIFAGNATTTQQGEPLSDAERYDLMAGGQIDRDRRPDEPGDLKFMFSSGPFPTLRPGRSLEYRVALVAGAGMEGMLRNALRASEVHRGRWVDVDGLATTGGGGDRETLVCLGDYPPYNDGTDPIYNYRANFMDEFCVAPDPIFGVEVINPTSLFIAPDGRRCIYVNADNCEECFRRHGRECTIANDLMNTPSTGYYPTGAPGGERYVPWIATSATPPVPPRARVVAGDNRAEIFWDDRSESDLDPYTGRVDFESYQVWRVSNWVRPEGATDSAGPAAELWGMLAEYDVISSVTDTGEQLGRNTGLEDIRYRPVCLDDPRFAGLDTLMQAFVDADTEGELLTFPSLRQPNGAPAPGREQFLPWESFPTVLDTFFAVTARAGRGGADPVQAKAARRYYHLLDDELHNGFRSFLAVVATDHLLEWRSGRYRIVGPGVGGDPGNFRLAVEPSVPAQTPDQRADLGVNIYVYPNPATREALAEFQHQPPSRSDPTGVRVMFNNLPAAHNRITIYTASGDLVATVEHDGTGGDGDASWNLMSRNGQEVVSGVYLFAVHSDDGRFAPFRGRFTVVR
ncbi:hypothetical protein KDM41_04755 [bacterium]|nr:hypothetical protein [bacterium]